MPTSGNPQPQKENDAVLEKTPIEELIENYSKGKLEKYDYIRQMNKINKSTYYLSKRLPSTDISKIEIEDNSLIFTTRKDGLKIKFSGRDRRGVPFDILNFQSYEEDELFWLFQFMTGEEIIFDIGANIGWFSLVCSKNFPKSKILSFEPIKHNFDFLLENVKLNNFSNIEAFNLGIAEKDDIVDFYFFPEGSVIASQKNLINCNKAKATKCTITTIDDFMFKKNIEKIDVLKCDVEGGELLVLQGGENAISNFLPIILIEMFHKWNFQFNYHPNEIISKLNKIGYICYYPHKDYLEEILDLNEEPVEERLNYIFLHLEKHKHLIEKIKKNL
jgi:FkbM family methyltransferase